MSVICCNVLIKSDYIFRNHFKDVHFVNDFYAQQFTCQFKKNQSDQVCCKKIESYSNFRRHCRNDHPNEWNFIQLSTPLPPVEQSQLQGNSIQNVFSLPSVQTPFAISGPALFSGEIDAQFDIDDVQMEVTAELMEIPEVIPCSTQDQQSEVSDVDQIKQDFALLLAKLKLEHRTTQKATTAISSSVLAFVHKLSERNAFNSSSHLQLQSVAKSSFLQEKAIKQSLSTDELFEEHFLNATNDQQMYYMPLERYLRFALNRTEIRQALFNERERK